MAMENQYEAMDEISPKRRGRRRKPATETDWSSMPPHLFTISEIQSAKKRGRPRKIVDYTCRSCLFTAPDAATFEAHAENFHKNAKIHVCPHCLAIFAQKGNLAMHVRTHDPIRPYTCKLCSFSAVQKNNLIVHLRTHTKEKPYQCSECEYRSAQLGNLRGHYSRKHAHGKEENPRSAYRTMYTCIDCGLVLKSQKELSAHREKCHPDVSIVLK